MELEIEAKARNRSKGLVQGAEIDHVARPRVRNRKGKKGA